MFEFIILIILVFILSRQGVLMNELEKAAREAYGNGFDDTADDPDYVDGEPDPWDENSSVDPLEKEWEEYCKGLKK